MAVVELARKRLRGVERTGVKGKTPPQIFVAHTSISETLMDDVGGVIRRERVRPFIAIREGNGVGAVDRIARGFAFSNAVFFILTKNALRRHWIRDWLLFEAGLAKARWVSFPVCSSRHSMLFGWRDMGVSLRNKGPLKTLMKYSSLNNRSKRSREAMLNKMRSIAHDISLASRL